MIRKIALAIFLASLLGGCSYSYDLIAVVRNGQIIIDVDPSSSHHPSCLRRIEVSAEGSREAAWLESVSYDDDCANRFPLPYGSRLRGQHQPESGEVGLSPINTDWHVAATGDYNGDGRDDILWRNDSGALANWLASASGGFAYNSAAGITQVPTSWHVEPPSLLF